MGAEIHREPVHPPTPVGLALGELAGRIGRGKPHP
jgi:hypothetical protein